MNQIAVQYKCRRCGVVVAATSLDDKGVKNGINNADAGDVLAAAISTSPQCGIGLYRVHACADGGRGISDLVGHSAPEPRS